MRVLDKLWRGQITPSEQYLLPNSECMKLTRELAGEMKQFVSLLPKETIERFEALEQLRGDLQALTEEDVFISGFRMGAQLMLDVLESWQGQYTTYPKGERI